MLSFLQPTPEKPYGYWLPLNLSTHGAEIDHLINLLHIFIFLLFVGWGIYFAYVLLRFRVRPGQPAEPSVAQRRFRFPLWLEGGIVVFELILLVYFSAPIWFRWKNNFPLNGDALHLRVVAQQFQWVIHYPGPDGKFGKTLLSLVDDANFLGLDPNDTTSKDDIVSLNHLHIPVGRPVVAHLSSKDVVHNFFIPVLRVKQDVIPGMTIPVWFQATGVGQNFEIACAQLCGNNHGNMRGFLHIDTAAEFENWLRQQESEK